MEFSGAMAVALAVDAVLGWPEQLFRRVGHPVTWLGRLIDRMDAACNRSSHPPALRRAAGAIATLLVIALPTILAIAVQVELTTGWSRTVIAESWHGHWWPCARSMII